MSITQATRPSDPLEILCCNVPDIFIEFSNDTISWKVFQSSLNDGNTVVNFAELEEISSPRM